MKTLANSLNYKSLKAFLQKLLLQARRADGMDLPVEMLLTIQCNNEKTPEVISRDDPDSTFNVFLSSSCGPAWVGVIKEIDLAKKALLFLRATQAGSFCMHDANARNVIDLLCLAADHEDTGWFHSTDPPRSRVTQRMEAGDENLVAAFISSGISVRR
jgi:hypothetical protein